MQRKCCRCHKLKDLDKFVSNKYKPLGKHYICKLCRNFQNRKKNKDNVFKLLEYLKTHPCIDCGIKDPLVLQFDHFKDKKDNVSNLVRNRAWKSVDEEIKKCVVRCANCHQKKTALERQTYMVQILKEEKKKNRENLFRKIINFLCFK